MMRFPLAYFNNHKKPHEPAAELFLVDEIALEFRWVEKTVFDLIVALRALRYIAAYPQNPRILWIIRFYPTWGNTARKYLKQASPARECLIQASEAIGKLIFEYLELLCGEGGV